jgi:HD-GYP domain-containing protein (c-di-GMP phosphodiesterase class II)
MTSFELVPVKLRTLPIDIFLECKIYSKNSLRNQEESGDASEYIVLCENQTFSQTLIDRLKRTIFPANAIYIHREYVISAFFDKGEFLGYSEKDVQDVRDGKAPWEKNRPLPPPIVSIPKPAMPVYKRPIDGTHILNLEQTTKIYEETKKVAEHLIVAAAETGEIDKTQSAEISEGVLRQVKETDASLIVRSINRIRTVDEYLHTHSLNVAYLNGLMGKWMEFDKVRQSELVEVGLLHDMGKLRVNQDILNKPAKLTPEEFEEIKKHPTYSLETLIKSGVSNKAILDGVHQHHEKVNGRGYPQSLDSKTICEFARITAISDIYDAMVTKRVYKDPHSPFVILNEFAAEGYSELDIKYVNIFIECMIEELKGKEIVMNDGSFATILLVNPRKLLYPIVEINGKTIMTNEDVYCVRMKDASE